VDVGENQPYRLLELLFSQSAFQKRTSSMWNSILIRQDVTARMPSDHWDCDPTFALYIIMAIRCDYAGVADAWLSSRMLTSSIQREALCTGKAAHFELLVQLTDNLANVRFILFALCLECRYFKAG
jgi:hypothetical protein